MKTSFPVKLGLSSALACLFIVLFGFVAFPKIIKSKVKQMVNLGHGTDIRDVFLEFPFPFKFNVYVFNVTNPKDVQNGALPHVIEVGPFCYDEWKVKLNVTDNEAKDTISYIPRDTFTKSSGPHCKSGQMEITIPNAIILATVNSVVRTKPGALGVINKAFKTIFDNPESVFLTAKVDDILFDGIEINCGVTDFAGKATCVELRESPALKARGNMLEFSFLGYKNATVQSSIRALRGTKNYRDVGRIVEYNGTADGLSTWPTKECNTITGTDGTVFPPLMKKEEGLKNFSPDICRSLTPFWVKRTVYDGIPVNKFTASLGDMSTNPEEKCYCYTNTTCLKKGIMDLYKCNSVPIYASLPHFYDADKSYVEGVRGLKPNQKDHEISILFEQMTGSPLQVRKRLQFSMALESTQKVDLFKNVTNTIIPLFWVEESLDLNRTFTKPLKMLYTLKSVVNIFTWLILIGSFGGMTGAAYLFYKNNNAAVMTVTNKVNETVGSQNEEDKY
ncbi:unnamed protein product [Phyllotreta striolata]|uniref:Sensory neuron membrane protein 1 n=1 Tax=Phyllotreta striolata TaxID=444603 RepID=A0A9N9TSR4_PHYSR|nr:unnamed protein product [Phyllotreta striolata]